ncbi:MULTISPECIES: SusD/RagB family nutrient-binding outer membrane lipoprotein [unclassified Cellulophaga]|uniref:SusD/RagB family nutrient-binding outer membrane lipoprotein n=1 Tax=unclassified Cellulophaga TaxID=2634405 RepID=UPI001C4F3941|nr:SusD/RagB family nutrient-binding outer membrane lipoprotein [Cellulophaga sp. HaHa_2_1]QXP54072.1 SusD/RagB family nutrient-binding outer membrane lipoprotein [Cellulophaga sp. HaHa_2_1]
MKTTKLIFIGLLLSLGISCEITGVNVDPDNPSAELVNAGAIYPGMIAQTHRNSVALGGRIAGIVTQQYDGLDAQQIAYGQYNIGETELSNLWDSGLYGAGSMRDCFVIMQNNPGEIGALAKLYMAANLGLATSSFGDVPYSEAFLGDTGTQTPKYDDQVELYAVIQNLLDESIADGVASGIGEFTGAGATGNINWEGTAHALKARYYMHLTSVNGVSAAQNALTEVQQAITSTDQQPDFIYSAPAQFSNPLALFDNDRPSTLGFGTYINSIMTGDPRLSIYTTDGESFAGLDGLFWGQFESPTPLISYWEVKFIEAEAIIRTGGSDTDALNALKDAILANMQYIGVPTADSNTYVDALSLAGSESDKIETIIVEKYKSLYGNAPIESWVDYRRTGFPVLTPNPDAVAAVNPSKIIPRRFLYPITERQTNLENYNAAISAQGGHLLDDDLAIFPNN